MATTAEIDIACTTSCFTQNFIIRIVESTIKRNIRWSLLHWYEKLFGNIEKCIEPILHIEIRRYGLYQQFTGKALYLKYDKKNNIHIKNKWLLFSFSTGIIYQNQFATTAQI